MHSTFAPFPQIAAYLSRARKAAGSTSGSSISVEVVAIPPLNMASKTALPTAKTNLAWTPDRAVYLAAILEHPCVRYFDATHLCAGIL